VNYNRVAGLDLHKVFRGKVEALKAHGVLEETDSKLALTPLGAFFADEIAQQFHHPDFIPYPKDDYHDGPLNPYLNQEFTA